MTTTTPVQSSSCRRQKQRRQQSQRHRKAPLLASTRSTSVLLVVLFLMTTTSSSTCFVSSLSTIPSTAFKTQRSFLVQSSSQQRQRYYMSPSTDDDGQIISPFDNSSESAENDPYAPGTGVATALEDDEILDLTEENVEKVLDTLRPYLIQDGGNVVISEIDGPVVYLELQGACGTCPSSTMTLKMGLERGLKERIPEIQEVVQAIPDGPELCEEQIEVVLDGVRPFLEVAGGAISVEELTGVGGLQPMIVLEMTGNAASLNSVKLEISQRLQRHFMTPGLRIEWKK